MNQKALHSLQKTWTKLGKMDPLWAILSDPTKENGRWQLDDFFDTGTEQLQELQSELSLIEQPFENERCLDFGCGIGRMSRAFSTVFREVHGVDIASSMIKEAKKYHQGYNNIEFHLNKKNDLKLFSDNYFDFIFSHIVLQHIPPAITKNYLQEFVRVLKPGGLIAFQLPSHKQKDKASFNAKIECDVEAKQYPGGIKLGLKATIFNIGKSTWSSYQKGQGPFRLGNHWYDANSQVVAWDDGRCEIPELAPGESCELVLEVTTPSKPGRYLLGLDVVQENVTWFEKTGSTVLKIPIEILSKKGFGSTESFQLNSTLRSRLIERLKNKFNNILTGKPAMEMHGIKKEEVVGILTKSGANVIKIKDDYSPGSNWKSYYYFAIK